MIEWILSSSALILVVVTLRYLLKGKISLWLQYALWALVLARLLIPVSVGESAWSAAGAAEALATVEDNLKASSLALPFSGQYQFNSIEEYDEFAAANRTRGITGGKNPEFRQITSSADGVVAIVPVTVPWMDALKALWLAGVTAVGLCLLLANLSFGRQLRKTRKKFPAGQCRLPVYQADALPSPCLFGLFRPAIYLTPDVGGDETKLRHVLAHELAHYRHGDHIWSALRGLCLALHWYNPLVWLAATLSRRDAELACDESTIISIGEAHRLEYGRTLIGLTCERRNAMDLLRCATTMTDGKKGIKQRILLIAKKPKMATYTLTGVILAAGLALAFTFTGAAGTDIVDCGAYTLELPSRFDYAFCGANGNEKDAAEFFLRGERAGGVDLYFYEGEADNLDDLREFRDFLKAEGLFENTESTRGGSSQQADFEFFIKPFDSREQKHYFFFASTDAVYDLWFETGAFTDGAIKRVCRSFTLSENGETVPLTAKEVEQYNRIFEPILDDGQGNPSVNPLSHFFTSYYDRPENIDLAEFLRYFPSEDVVTDEAEFEALKAAKNWPFGADRTLDNMPVPIHKFPADTVNEALQTYMGITLGDLSGVGLDELIYLKKYDAYYNFTSDFAAGTFVCGNGERQGDIIRLYSERATLTLKKQGDGYLFVSHQRIGEAAAAGGDANGAEFALAGAVVAFADLNRDGMEETLYLDKSQMDSGSFVTLRVYGSNGNEIWSEDAGTPHAGWNSLFLCNLEGKDYLLRYNPGMWQGRATYTYTLFKLEGGAEKVYQTDTLEFDINGTEPLDPQRMVGFADEVNALLQRSTLLLSSEGGAFTFGPASAKPFLETYSWLDGNPELYAEGDDLATRLQKYSDYAVSHRARTN